MEGAEGVLGAPLDEGGIGDAVELLVGLGVLHRRLAQLQAHHVLGGGGQEQADRPRPAADVRHHRLRPAQPRHGLLDQPVQPLRGRRRRLEEGPRGDAEAQAQQRLHQSHLPPLPLLTQIHTNLLNRGLPMEKDVIG